MRQDRSDRREPSLPQDREAGGYYDPRGRDNQQQRAAFSRYSNAAPPAPPVAPQRSYDAPPPPPPPGQGYYPDQPPQRPDPARSYGDSSPASFVPPQPYQPDPVSGYGDGRDDLFGREPLSPAYDQGPYSGRSDPYPASYPPLTPPSPSRRDDPYPRETPIDDYSRDYAARAPQPEAPAQRFYLPENQGQRPAAQDRGYTPSLEPDHGYSGQYQPQSYNPASYGSSQPQQPAYGLEGYDPQYAGHESWAGDDHGLDDGRGLPQRVGHGDELDEDFFADEDDFDHDDLHQGSKRSRKKLIAAALVGAIGVGGGGAYLYKSLKGGGDSAMPVIHADNRPSKELPGNPGGKQYPNGEKAIYDRILPDGRQVQATFTPAAAPVDPAFGSPSAPGTMSLEEGIERALKKAQQSGDAPQAAPGGDRPTVVKPEVYRPDGTRVDPSRPMVTPSIVNINGGGNLPPPFGPGPSAAQPQSSAPQFRTATQPQPQSLPVSPPAQKPQPVRQAALAPSSEQAAVTAEGYFVSLKSAPDEKAIQRDIPGLNEKYKAVLGDVQIAVKIADLGAKGVTYRAVAGPLGTHQEANDLCNKIKGAGGSCFVTK